MTPPKQPEDHKPKKSAVQREAEGDASPIVLDFRGVTVTLPPLDDVPFEALLRFEEGKAAAFFAALITDEDRDALFALRPRLTVKEWGEQLEKLAVEYGFTSTGNSGASSDS